MFELAELQREPRNIVWVRDTEERLEKSLEFSIHDEYVVRALECRTTRCAIEVVSSIPYQGDRERDPGLEEGGKGGIRVRVVR